MIVVVDYHMGNLGSVMNMFSHVGVEAILSSKPEEIARADKLVLPGDGAFDSGMKNLNDLGIASVLHEKVLGEGTPILGVCLGMQLFGTGSEEGSAAGLGWIDAYSRRFNFTDEHADLRVPHMSWNNVQVCKENDIVYDLPPDTRYYFLHSYYVQPNDERDVLTKTFYGIEFASGISKGLITGVQFHPEKSLRWGMQLFKRFACIDVRV